jgi:acyl carrier protein
MNTDEAESLVRDCLRQLAPESPPDAVALDADYREQLAIDSLDFLQLVELLSARSGVRIDESDYPRLSTIGSAAAFLAAGREG